MSRRDPFRSLGEVGAHVTLTVSYAPSALGGIALRCPAVLEALLDAADVTASADMSHAEWWAGVARNAAFLGAPSARGLSGAAAIAVRTSDDTTDSTDTTDAPSRARS